MSCDLVKIIGKQLVNDINSIDNKWINEAELDDYDSHSGKIIVYLNMRKSTGYIFDNYTNRPLRKISAQIRGVIKKHKHAELNFMESPKSRYVTHDYQKSWEGYDKNYIVIDFEI